MEYTVEVRAKFLRHFPVIALVGAVLLSAGCFSSDFTRTDMNTVRRQFHLPKEAVFLQFDSYPKEAGFFGREGLRTTATVGFSEDLFEEYTARLDVEHGEYYCSAIVVVKGEPLKNNPAAYHLGYVGKSCSELNGSEHPAILTFAVLDYEEKSIHVQIRFSG